MTRFHRIIRPQISPVSHSESHECWCLFVSTRPGLPADLLLGSYEERLPSGCSQVQLGFRYESRDQRFTIYVMQLSNCSALCLPTDQKMYELTPVYQILCVVEVKSLQCLYFCSDMSGHLDAARHTVRYKLNRIKLTASSNIRQPVTASNNNNNFICVAPFKTQSYRVLHSLNKTTFQHTDT